MLFRGQDLVEGVLKLNEKRCQKCDGILSTIDKMATQGKFNELTILWANVDLPEPELPAMPIMLVSAQGGE